MDTTFFAIALVSAVMAIFGYMKPGLAFIYLPRSWRPFASPALISFAFVSVLGFGFTAERGLTWTSVQHSWTELTSKLSSGDRHVETTYKLPPVDMNSGLITATTGVSGKDYDKDLIIEVDGSLLEHSTTQNVKGKPARIGNVEGISAELIELSPDVRQVKLETTERGSYDISFEFTPSTDVTVTDDVGLMLHTRSKYVAEAMALLRVAGQTLSNGGLPVQSIEMRLKAKMNNRYGNPVSEDSMTITLSGLEFNKINWANITNLNLLDLVHARFSKEGMDIARYACNDMPDLTSFCSDFKKQRTREILEN